MARINVGTAYTSKELEKIAIACKKQGLSLYKFLQQAGIEKADHVLKEKKEIERENGSGTERRGQEALKIRY